MTSRPSSSACRVSLPRPRPRRVGQTRGEAAEADSLELLQLSERSTGHPLEHKGRHMIGGQVEVEQRLLVHRAQSANGGVVADDSGLEIDASQAAGVWLSSRS